MQYSDLKQRVANETGMDLTTDGSIVGAWVNQAYQHISGIFNWPWLFQNTTIQTIADITTGTVSVTAGSTTITFSSAPVNSVANDYMIQFATTQDWYFITSHTGGATTAVINVPFVGTSNLVAGAYTLRKVFYSLPSAVDRVIDIRQSITKDKLMYIDPRSLDRIIPDVNISGTPLYYTMVGYDGSNNWRIGFLPTPNATVNLQVRYYIKITELVNDTDLPLLPPKWHNALVFGALAMYGMDFIDDTRVKDAGARYTAVIQEMLAHNSPVPDQLSVIQPWDTRVRTQPFRLRFPSNYPDWFR